MIKVIVAACLYGLFFGTVELLSRRTRLSKETSRKFIHILAGATAAFLPFALTFRQIVYLSLLFIPVMLLSKHRNFLLSIHAVRRHTYGEVYFPLAILVTAFLFPHKSLYIYGLLVMAISDGLASVIGQKFGRRRYRFWASTKSYVGSLTFFLSATIIGFLITATLGTAPGLSLLIGLVLAVLLAVCEATLAHGLDNLVLPPLASLLLWSAIKLFRLG